MRYFNKYKTDSLKIQLIKGASGTAFLKVLNTILALGVGIFLARLLGPENFGIYTFVFSLIALLGLPTKAGLPTLIVREVAKKELNKKWGALRGLLTMANGFIISYSFLVSVISIVFVLWQFTYSTKDYTFLWALCLLPIIALSKIRGATLKGFRKVILGQIPEQIIHPLVMIGLLAIVYWGRGELSPVLAIKFNILAALISFAVGVYFLLKFLPNEVKIASSEYELKNWLISIVPLSLFAGLKIADTQLTIVLLGTLGSSEDVGLYRVAQKGAAFMVLGLTAVNTALAPQVARLYSEGNVEKLQRVITVSTRAILAVSFPMAIVLIFWGDLVIGWVFGADYIRANRALQIICVGQLINTSAGSVALVLNMTGHDKETLKGIIVALILNVLLSFILIPIYGLNGAAISSVVSLVSWNLILMRQTYIHTGLNTFVFNFKFLKKK